MLNDFLQKNMNGTAYCQENMVSAIECRTVVGHKSPKATGQNVECSLERGLMCAGKCFDYEIRVLCDCGWLNISSLIIYILNQIRKQCMLENGIHIHQKIINPAVLI